MVHPLYASDHRPPISPGAMWSHRGAFQDELGGTLRTFLGARNGPPTLSHPHCAFLGRTSGPAPPHQSPCTVRCACVRHIVRFPGTTANVFWRPATLLSHAWGGFAANATRCSPRESTFGTRATMGCGGFEQSARVRRSIEYTWSDFRTTRGQSSLLSLRPGTRPQRGVYEVRGVSRST